MSLLVQLLRNLNNTSKNLYILFFGPIKYLKKCGTKIGSNCRIYTINFGSEPWLIELGNNVTITSGVKFLTHDGSMCLFQDFKGRRFSYNKISIGNNVFIGVNSIIMPGVVIGNNVIIGAGSVVTKSIPDNYIVGGNPARFLKRFKDQERISLNNYPSILDLDFSLSYKERVLKILGNNIKSSL
jgi:acetyltransferase-like isoleucine patch superfamily enzyme